MNVQAIEELIIRGATEGERNAAKRAWEKHTGKTWTGEREKPQDTFHYSAEDLREAQRKSRGSTDEYARLLRDLFAQYGTGGPFGPAGFHGGRTPGPEDFRPGPSAREYHGHYDPFFGGRREPNPEPPGGSPFGRQVHGGRGQAELEEALRGCELGDFEIREPARRGLFNNDEYVVVMKIRRGRPQYTYHPPGGPPPKEPK